MLIPRLYILLQPRAHLVSHLTTCHQFIMVWQGVRRVSSVETRTPHSDAALHFSPLSSDNHLPNSNSQLEPTRSGRQARLPFRDWRSTCHHVASRRHGVRKTHGSWLEFVALMLFRLCPPLFFSAYAPHALVNVKGRILG